jgi:CRP/FNR family transcriptional regulator, cyclic AMP receptor protein
MISLQRESVQHDNAEFLKRVPLFNGFGDDEIIAVSRLLRTRRLTKHTILMYEGDPSDALYIIKEGSVAVTRVSSEGKETILSILKEGDVLGEMGVLDEAPRSATVTLLRDGLVLVLRREDFLALLAARPELNRAVISGLVARLRATNQATQTRSHLSVKAKVADLLLMLGENFGEPADNGTRLTVKLTHQQLASMVATTRETMSRTLIEFWDAKLIDMTGAYIVISDPISLAAMRT